MHDVEDFDPLDDILLSDEEQDNKSSLLNTNKSYLDSKTNNDKQKTFEELFGVKDNEKEDTLNTDTRRNKSDWLDLKDNFQDEKQYESNFVTNGENIIKTDIDAKTLPINNIVADVKTSTDSWLGLSDIDTNGLGVSSNTKPEINNVSNNVINTNLEFSTPRTNIAENLQVRSESDVDRRKSEGSSSASVSHKAFKKQTSQFKSLDLLDSLFGKSGFKDSKEPPHFKPEATDSVTPKSRNQTANLNSSRKTEATLRRPSTTSIIVERNQDGDKSYVPTVGSSRRSGLSRSRDFLNMSGLNIDLETDLVSNAAKKVADNSPSWLNSGIKENPIAAKELKKELSSLKLDTNQKLSENDIQENKDKSTKNIKESLEQNDEDDVATNAGSGDLSVVFDLKKKQSELRSMARNQSELIAKQDREIRVTLMKLVDQHHRNISSLIKAVSGEAESDIDFNYSLGTKQHSSQLHQSDEDENPVFSLVMKIKQLELENGELQMKLQYMERRLDMEISSLEESYRYKLELALEREERLKHEIDVIEEGHRMKLKKEKENESELIQIYRDRMERLQMDHNVDIKRIEELNNIVTNRFRKSDALEKERTLPLAVLNDSEISSRESSLISRERQLKELQEEVDKQKLTVEHLKRNLDARMEEFEVTSVKEKSNLEQRVKDLKQAELIFSQKQTSWDKDRQRDMAFIENDKREIEISRENLLKEERRIAKQKFELAMEKSRLEAVAQLEGVTSGRLTDMAQARAEVQGAIEEARKLKSVLEEERNTLKNEQRKVKQEQWRLKEFENDLSLRTKHIEQLIQQVDEKREEGIRSFRKAKQIEREVNEKMEDIAQKLLELQSKEEKIMMEKINISKERDVLNKRKFELDNTIISRQMTYDTNVNNQIPYNQHSPISLVTNRGIIDPKFLILKLKAEQSLDSRYSNAIDIS